METTTSLVFKMLMLLFGVIAVLATTSDDQMAPPADCTDGKVLWFNDQLCVSATAVPSDGIHGHLDFLIECLNAHVLLYYFILFLPRDDMHGADYTVTRCLSVGLSVRPSHSVLCQNSWTYFQTFSADSDTILVFPHQTLYSDGDLLMRSSNAKAV